MVMIMIDVIEITTETTYIEKLGFITYVLSKRNNKRWYRRMIQKYFNQITNTVADFYRANEEISETVRKGGTLYCYLTFDSKNKPFNSKTMKLGKFNYVITNLDLSNREASRDY